MTLFGVLFYTLNETLIIGKIGARDIGGGLLIHSFGALFGVFVSFMLK